MPIWVLAWALARVALQRQPDDNEMLLSLALVTSVFLAAIVCISLTMQRG